jgi:hypothetical protein
VDKFLMTALLFIVIFVTGYFGQHFGYTVDGVPKGSLSETEITETVKIGDIPFFDYEPTIEVDKSDSWSAALTYIWDFASFRIDDVPPWLTGFFDLMILLALVLIWTMIRGG